MFGRLGRQGSTINFAKGPSINYVSSEIKGDKNRYLVLNTADVVLDFRFQKRRLLLRVIKPKAMKNDKGREGGLKIGKMGHRPLWMT